MTTPEQQPSAADPVTTSKAPEVTPALLAETINSMADSFNSDLLSKSKEQLEGYWHFKFDAKKSIEANIYEFHDLLTLYGTFCRRWEEHHKGSCCVVERVRDEYLWPKIKQFADDLRDDIAGISNVEVEALRRVFGLRLCIGNRWKCDNGHEWVSAHCDATWFCIPTMCPECGQTATAHRGEWKTLEQLSNAQADTRHE